MNEFKCPNARSGPSLEAKGFAEAVRRGGVSRNGGNATEVLAAFITETDYGELPPPVTNAAKRLVLDSLGCAIGGVRLIPGQITIDIFESMGGVGESTVWATGKRIPCLQAAYVNAYLANLLDFDDTYIGAGHPGATVVQSGLAVAEKAHASGRQLLTAVVVGYEVSIRIGLAIRPSVERYRLGWGGYGFHIFGAATVASKLLGLDQLATARAFGLAGISAPVQTALAPDQRAGGRVFGWSKCDCGWRALGGILAALKASKGFIAHTSVLDGERGYWRTTGSDRCDFELMTSGLGEEFLILGVEHKPYPTCRWTHSSLDALNAILESRTLDPDDVKNIRVRTFSQLVKNCNIAAPSDIVEAQFSLPYLIALRLHGHSLTPLLLEEDLGNAEILNTAKKVIIECDPEAENESVTDHVRPATVTIETVAGESYSMKVRHGRGGKDQVLPDAQLQEKFLGLAEPVVGAGRAERVLRRIEHLEEIDDVSTLWQH